MFLIYLNNRKEANDMKINGLEKSLLTIGALVAIISLFYIEVFPYIYVIPAIIFLIRAIKSAKKKITRTHMAIL